jgi:hypothetical protein
MNISAIVTAAATSIVPAYFFSFTEVKVESPPPNYSQKVYHLSVFVVVAQRQRADRVHQGALSMNP